MIDLVAVVGLSHFIWDRDLSWMKGFPLSSCPFCQGFWTGIVYYLISSYYNNDFDLLGLVVFGYASSISYQIFYIIYNQWQES